MGIFPLLSVILISLIGCQSPAIYHVSSTPTPGPLRVFITGLVDTPLLITAENVGEYPPYDRATTMVCPDGIYETEDATCRVSF